MNQETLTKTPQVNPPKTQTTHPNSNLVKQYTDRNYIAMVERSTECYVREVLCSNQGLLLKVK